MYRRGHRTQTRVKVLAAINSGRRAAAAPNSLQNSLQKRPAPIPLWDFDVWRRQTALSGYNAFAVTFSEWGHGGRESQLGGVNPDHSPTHKRARGVVKRSIAAASAPIASVLGKENARKSPSR